MFICDMCEKKDAEIRVANYELVLNSLRGGPCIDKKGIDLCDNCAMNFVQSVVKNCKYIDPVQPVKPVQKSLRRDVHTEHCCLEHRICKYGEEDHCTVVQGWADPTYPCNCEHF